MPAIHVCPLSRVEATARAIGAKTMVTLLSRGVDMSRPLAIARERHLHLMVSDIVEHAEGEIVPSARHVNQFLEFARAWDQREPMLVHCHAGVSRSTAAAFIAVCALRPDQPENDVAQRLRRASRTATPNRKLVALADQALGRGGRMVEAVLRIGRGAECFEGEPFGLPLD